MQEQDFDKNSILFTRLVLWFQTTAMQGMGKLVDPESGKIKRDMLQASFSIDSLDMLRTKCKGNLTPAEENMLNQMISDLKLNYVDEMGRPEPESDDKTPSPEQETEEQENSDTDEPE